MAMAFVGKRIELAIAAILAGAVDELAPLELPVGYESDTLA
jgi:hypothetical protein